MKRYAGPGCAILFAGCAQLQFDDDHKGGSWVHFYDPIPVYQVTQSSKCEISTAIVTLPGAKRSVKPKPGFGSSELTATFDKGILTAFGQKSDGQADEFGAVLGTALGLGGYGIASTGDDKATHTCTSVVAHYPIVYDETSKSAKVDFNNPISTLPIS